MHDFKWPIISTQVLTGDAEGRVAFPTAALQQRALKEMAAREVAIGFHIALHDPNAATGARPNVPYGCVYR